MRNKESKMGFTLIELLVVVLIIGILASVALPQYQKAVRKARLSEVATTFSSISKGIDMYLLENGYPDGDTSFSGNGSGSDHAQLDITQSCTSQDSDGCYTKVGRWNYSCYHGCGITLDPAFHADGTRGNKWLDESGSLYWSRGETENQWSLVLSNVYPVSIRQEVCLWWSDMYGKGRVTDGYGGINTDTCAIL